ncbi:hypothetical protein [Microcoleus sp. herbarium14]|uniref:hypothetical protein n=1 Tax=Microcoleus sp. herbarium14 TaxID=3055439 RepID=UPI002FD4CE50
MKFNFAVLWVELGFLRANFVWGESGAIAVSSNTAVVWGRVYKAAAACENRLFL